MIHNWSDEEAAAAKKQGWMLVEVWDGRLVVEIFRDEQAAVFLDNTAARAHVAREASAARDALCMRAWGIVFRSQ